MSYLTPTPNGLTPSEHAREIDAAAREPRGLPFTTAEQAAFLASIHAMVQPSLRPTTNNQKHDE